MSHVTLPLSYSDQERFVKNLAIRPDKPDACWEWRGGRTATGGRFWLQGETRYPHIVAWLLANGDIPVGFQVLRTCKNRYCCRVSHMKLGHATRTTDENRKERFFAKTRPGAKRSHMDTPCLEWTGGHDIGGYGVTRFDGKQKKAHQVVWFFEHGVWIPRPGLIMHACDNPPCVNIEHLKLGDPGKNVKDRDQKGRQAQGPTHGSRTKPESVPRGVKNGRAKLKEFDVIQIRLTFAANANAHGIYEGLARRYRVDASTIRDAVTSKLWPRAKIEDYPTIKPIPLSELSFGHRKGEDSPFAKISDATVRAIQLEYDQAPKKWGMISKLARQFDISPSHVHRIVNGEAR